MLVLLIVAAVIIVIGCMIYAYYASTTRCPQCGQNRVDKPKTGDVPVCATCAHANEMKAKADAEAMVPCPHGHGDMEKIIKDDVIMDVCETCGHHALDAGEYEKLQQMAYDRGNRDGRSSAQSSQAAMNTAVALSLVNAANASHGHHCH